MPATFLSLPGEIRNEIYRYLLVGNEAIDPWHHDQALSPNILGTNSTILHEARFFLYGHNTFTTTTPLSYFDRTSDFLDKIGPSNASFIRAMRMPFPGRVALSKASEIILGDEIPLYFKFTLPKESTDALEKLALQCASLKTLTICPYGALLPTGLLHPNSRPLFAEVVSQLCAYLKRISSLEKIIVDTTGVHGNFDTEGYMENFRRHLKDWPGIVSCCS